MFKDGSVFLACFCATNNEVHARKGLNAEPDLIVVYLFQPGDTVKNGKLHVRQ
jgi:hypothetical protein